MFLEHFLADVEAGHETESELVVVDHGPVVPEVLVVSSLFVGDLDPVVTVAVFGIMADPKLDRQEI